MKLSEMNVMLKDDYKIELVKERVIDYASVPNLNTPELLILDEPLHGLDTYNRRRVKKVIEAFCRRKDKTMIMVTHYESELPDTITNRIFLKRNDTLIY